MLRFTPGWVIFLLTPMFGGCVIYTGVGDNQGAAGGADAKKARTDETDQYRAHVI
jgi:hypothetical protein